MILSFQTFGALTEFNLSAALSNDKRLQRHTNVTGVTIRNSVMFTYLWREILVVP